MVACGVLSISRDLTLRLPAYINDVVLRDSSP